LRVLVVGSGAREHVLAWKLARDAEVEEVYAAPGNPGISGVANCVPIAADATVELAEFAASLKIDLTVVGPELPLVMGLADEFERRRLLAVGPSRAAAELEGSKVFTKEFCLRHGIPTAEARVVHDRAEAAAAVKALGLPIVFKADGLAAGKGVVVCHSKADVDAAMVRFFDERAFGAAADRVLVEECLEGEEATFMVLADGSTVLPLASARDYKRLEDGDRGPNTGGMGAVSPASTSSELAHEVLRSVVIPTVDGLAAEGRPYRGVLYAGLMLTADGPKLLEFNCRLGDPEAQAVLPRLEDDIVPLLRATARGELAGMRTSWRHEATVCVCLAAHGYPAGPRRGDVITGVADALALPGVLVFQAGTAVREGRLVTAGGRVISVVGRGATLEQAAQTAYEAADRIHFDGMQMRRDIGKVRR
jgi:phosphoribosylamine--glycine ligase